MGIKVNKNFNFKDKINKNSSNSSNSSNMQIYYLKMKPYYNIDYYSFYLSYKKLYLCLI